MRIYVYVYGEAMSLRDAGAPEGASPIQSQSGVLPDDPLAPLVLSLTLQPVLEHAEARVAEAVTAPVAYRHDVSIADMPAAGHGAGHFQTSPGHEHREGPSKGLRIPSISLELNLGKGGVHAGVIAAVAKELGIWHLRQGMMSVGIFFQLAFLFHMSVGTAR